MPKFTSVFSRLISIRSVQVICFILLFLNLLALLYGSTFLRPSADDYCFGATVAAHGILGGIFKVWMTWSSSVFTMFLVNLFVGAPLVYLPLSLVSSISFVISILGVGLAGYAFYPETMKDRFNKILFASLAGFFWWTFLWSRGALGLKQKLHHSFSLMAGEITHWQNLNGAYVAPVLAVLLVYAWMAGRADRKGPLFKAAAVLTGLAVGFAGSMISLGVFCFGLGALGYLFFKRKSSSTSNLKTDMRLWILFCAAAAAGALISHTFSPGHTIRQEILNPDLTISLARLCELALFTFKGLIRFLLETYRSYPAIFLVLATASFSSVFTGSRLKAENPRLWLALTGASFFLLSLVLAGAANVGGFFIFVSCRHLIPATLSAYLALFFAGLALGAHISSRYEAKKFFAPLGLIIMAFYTWTNIYALGDILEREARWRVGPAPTLTAADIETDWVRGCFYALNRHRKSPLIREPEPSSQDREAGRSGPGAE